MIFFCLTPLSMLISRFIHVAATGIISCFFMTESYFSLYVCAPTTSFSPSFFFSPVFMCLFSFGCAKCLLLLGLFSSCGRQGLHSGCGTWDSHCGVVSGRGAHALGCEGFRSCGTWALEQRLSS